tara:strand:+ start:275 stop:499 length:225 start_codon:yes stop_codon:yes gene_type:complete
MSDSQMNSSEPILTFDGKRYEIKNLSEEAKELIRGMQVADAQLRIYEDTLKILSIGRHSITQKLKEKLQNVNPI